MRGKALPGNLAEIGSRGLALYQTRSQTVRLLYNRNVDLCFSDKCGVRRAMQEMRAGRPPIIPWAMQMKAVAAQDPSHLVRSLTGAILGCGGWVLSRGTNDEGIVSMLFEFERQACVDIYSVLVAAGLELSPSGHIRFTELCQCTRNQRRNCGAEVASVDLEIETFPPEAMGSGLDGDAA